MLPSEMFRVVVKRGEVEKARKAGKFRWGQKAGGAYTSEQEAVRQFEYLQEAGIDCTLYRTDCFWQVFHEGQDDDDDDDDNDGGGHTW